MIVCNGNFFCQDWTHSGDGCHVAGAVRLSLDDLELLSVSRILPR